MDRGKKSKRSSMFEIFLTHRAEKALKSLDVKVKRRIETVLNDLAYPYFPKKYELQKVLKS